MSIYHISDIHIHARNNERIKYAFDKLISAITNDINYPNNCMLIIAGDVFEYKTTYACGDIEMFKYIVDTLETKLIKTIIIVGNHDYNDNINNNLISPLLTTHNVYVSVIVTSRVFIHTLSQTKMCFYIRANNDKKLFFSTPNNDDINICLYHGQVSQDYALALSRSYTLSILGDSHVHQFLHPNVAYSGSFVQKHKGENLIHGYILWSFNSSLRSFSSTFVLLPQYKVDVFIRSGDDFEQYNNIYEPRTIGVLLNGSDDPMKDKVLARFKNIDYIKYASVPITSTSTNEVQLLRACAGTKYADDIVNLHKEYTSDLNKSAPHTRWKLDYMQWENIYKYEKKSFIRFDKTTGIVALQGMNAVGKSTIIHIMCALMFGGSHTKDVPISPQYILNNSNTRGGYITAGITCGADKYVITRIFTRNTNTCGEMTLSKNGVVISSGDILKTRTIVETICGTREDFLNINVMQSNRTSILDFPNAQLCAYLSRIFGIDHITDANKKNQSRINEIRARLTKFASLMPVEQCRECIDKYESLIKSYNDELVVLRQESLEHEVVLSTPQPVFTTIIEPCDEVNEQPAHLIDGESTLISYLLDKFNEHCDNLNIPRIKPSNNITNDYSLDIPVAPKKDTVCFNYQSIYTDEQILKAIECIPIVQVSSSVSLTDAPSLLNLLNSYPSVLRELESNRAKYNTLNEKWNKCTDEFNKTYDRSLPRAIIDDAESGIPINLKKDGTVSPTIMIKEVAKLEQSIDSLVISRRPSDTINNRKTVFNMIYAVHSASTSAINDLITRNDAIRLKYEQNEREFKSELQTLGATIKKQETQIDYIQKIASYYRAQLDKYNAYNKYKQIILELVPHARDLLYTLQCINETKKYRKFIIYKEHKAQYEYAEELKSKKLKASHRLQAIKARINVLELELKNNQRIIGTYEASLRESLSAKQQAEEMRNQLARYEVYDKCTNNKSGIMDNLLKRVVDNIVIKWNQHLSKVVNFTIDYIKEPFIKFMVKEETTGLTTSVDVASGWQKFIINLTLRATLAEMAEISIPNFIVIDEGFGTADEVNIPELKSYFKSSFCLTYIDFTIIIAQQAEINEIADHKIIICDSTINYGDSDDIREEDISIVVPQSKRKTIPRAQQEQKKAETMRVAKIMYDIYQNTNNIVDEYNAFEHTMIDMNNCIACNKSYSNISSHRKVDIHMQNVVKKMIESNHPALRGN